MLWPKQLLYISNLTLNNLNMNSLMETIFTYCEVLWMQMTGVYSNTGHCKISLQCPQTSSAVHLRINCWNLNCCQHPLLCEWNICLGCMGWQYPTHFRNNLWLILIHSVKLCSHALSNFFPLVTQCIKKLELIINNLLIKINKINLNFTNKTSK